jgi:hypothetical protein
LKKALKYLGYLLALFLIFTAGFMRNVEPIPNNAQIDVFPSKQIWLPHSTFIGEKFERLMDDEESLGGVLELMTEITPTTYSEIRHGKFKGYEIHSDFGKTKDFTTGANQSLLMHWIAPEKNRWNSDGTWNY